MKESAIKKIGIGASTPRKEDYRLLTGQGQFSDDFYLEGQVYAIMVRSPHPHAKIVAINTLLAKNLPGVLAVLIGQDMMDDGLKNIPHTPFGLGTADISIENKDGTPIRISPHYSIALERVRYVGEVVAVVVANSVEIAKDGAELVEVEYDILQSVTNTREAAEPNAPLLWDQFDSNVCLDAVLGDSIKAAQIFDHAEYVVKFDTVVQRVTAVPMEPRSTLAKYDPNTSKYIVYTCSSGAVRVKNDLAIVLGVPPDYVRVVIGDVGGHFGARGMLDAECVIVTWAARKTGRPVKWTSDRSEGFLSDYQGRDLTVSVELAIDNVGNFLAMRGKNISNLGAYTVSFQPLQKGVEIMTSLYQIPIVDFHVQAVISNTPPTRPYRSAGRPEVMYVMERLIDLAAFDYGFDRVDLRRRNLIPPEKLPFKNPFGMIYDNGRYQEAMDLALRLSDWDNFEKRRQEAVTRGKCLGIGVSNYIDTGTGAPRERAEIKVQADGNVDVIIGTVSTGQGHETSFAQLLTEWLNVPIDKVRILTGDTAFVKVGGGTHSGRGMRMASIVIWNCVQEIIDKGRKITSLIINCNLEDVIFEDGRFIYKETEQSISLFELAAAFELRKDWPNDLKEGLFSISDITNNTPAFSYGSHVCEVEIDPDLGTLIISGYTAVDDVGLAINPMIVDGQTHGGIVQGVGQALMEQCFYDSVTGQLLSGSLMDYAIPRADSFPFFSTAISEVASTSHPIGVRPGGEGGTTPALGVVINAITHALSGYGVRHVEMPATPERIVKAIYRK
jgi:carbon-monoxide dehydrogenase large subunit